MRWTERQQVMLREIGVRLWLPPEDASDLAEGNEADRHEPAVVAGARAPARSGEPSGGATDVEIADSGWAELAAGTAACTACPLAAGRTRPVFVAEPQRADWMLVGEAPAADDDRAGAPYAGRAGQLLDNMLQAAGLSRAATAPQRRVHATHAAKCHPPGQRAPEPGELARCEGFLVRELELAQPRVILALGRGAAQSLLRSTEPFGRLRSQVHRYRGVALVVTFAPDYLLRHPEDKEGAWDDLCLALQTVKDSSPD